jgi:hypothetical protein
MLNTASGEHAHEQIHLLTETSGTDEAEYHRRPDGALHRNTVPGDHFRQVGNVA